MVRHHLRIIVSVGRQELKVTKTIGAAYVERKGESVIGRNPQQMRVIEVEGSDTLADCTPNTNFYLKGCWLGSDGAVVI